MRIIEQAPDWAREVLAEAVHSHPGRPDDQHLGISTVTYDPTLTHLSIQGKPLPEDEDQGNQAKGTLLHQLLYGNAPNRETEVRVPIEGTGGLYWHGHFDSFSLEGLLRDLKTTNVWNLTDEKLEEYLDQMGLYAHAIENGEARNEDGEWVPAKEVLGTDEVHTLIVDWWGGSGLQWEAERLEGDEARDRIDAAVEKHRDMVHEMLAGTWEPGETAAVTVEQKTPDDAPAPPQDLRELVLEAGWTKDQADIAEKEYDAKRAEIHEIQAATIENTVEAGPYQAVYNSPSTREELDMDAVQLLLEEAGLELGAFRDETRVARVTDEELLAEKLSDLGMTGLEGVEVTTKTQLDEDALETALEQIEEVPETLVPEDEDAPENGLEAATIEKVSQSGYTYIQRRDA